ncbi:MAG: hypothetical protein ACOZQL_07930 [Myxococcota bacterium]
MSYVPMLLSSLVVALPHLVVLVALVALAISRWNRHPRVSMLAASAGVLMLLIDLVAHPLVTALPLWLVEHGRTASEAGIPLAIVGFGSSVLSAIGLGVLVAAVFAERRA